MTTTVNNNQNQIVELPVEMIYSDDNMNCRGRIAPYDVLELARSIEKSGLLSPIAVQPYDSVPGFRYRIILGHRRHKAFQVLKRETIPCVVKDGLTEVQVRILNLQENIERKDLNVLQEAHAIQKFKLAGYTLAEVANMVGMST